MTSSLQCRAERWEQLPLTRFPHPGEVARSASYSSASTRCPRVLLGGKLLDEAFYLRPGQEVVVFADVPVDRPYGWESLVWDFETRRFGWVQSFCLETDL